jgi:hypothetical protein
LQSYISKIDILEKDFKKLEEKVVDKDGIGEIRGEFKKVVGGVRGEGLELKERLAGLGMFFSLFLFYVLGMGIDLGREGCCYVDEECEDAVAASGVM